MSALAPARGSGHTSPCRACSLGTQQRRLQKKATDEKKEVAAHGGTARIIGASYGGKTLTDFCHGWAYFHLMGRLGATSMSVLKAAVTLTQTQTLTLTLVLTLTLTLGLA